MANLKYIIEGIEENNDINEANWSDLVDSDSAFDVYAVEGFEDEDISEDEARELIQRAIDSNGESLKTDLPAHELKVWGQNFSGSFWDRAE